LFDELDDFGDFFCLRQFFLHRFDCLAGVVFGTVNQAKGFLDQLHAFGRKIFAFQPDKIDSANFSGIAVGDHEWWNVLDNFRATAGDGEPADPAKLMHGGEPAYDCVIATPNVGVSTPKAFRDWDEQVGEERAEQQRVFNRRAGDKGYVPHNERKLTAHKHSGTINGFSHSVFAWLCGTTPTGVSSRAGNRAEALLLDLVRAGIENDFERVVFPQHPELRDVKRVLEREGARYTSLSGSGSAVYGIFGGKAAAEGVAKKLAADGIPAQATTTLPRGEYWQKILGN